jgi:hypothetical protein
MAVDKAQFDRPLDAPHLQRNPRIAAAAEALHNARREVMTGRIYGQKWEHLWPEYQLQLLKEAQAVVWAIDAVTRSPPPVTARYEGRKAEVNQRSKT